MQIKNTIYRSLALAAVLGLGATARADAGPNLTESALGYDRTKFAGLKDDSVAWIGGAGVEFQFAPAVTVTPYLRYSRTNGFADRNTADYGVKGNYWLTKELALTGAVGRDDAENM